MLCIVGLYLKQIVIDFILENINSYIKYSGCHSISKCAGHCFRVLQDSVALTGVRGYRFCGYEGEISDGVS